MNAAWDYQKGITQIFKSIDREWNDRYLDEARQKLKHALGNVINYEKIKKNTVTTEYGEIIKNEKNAVNILNTERLLFDYSLFTHAAKELIPDIEKIVKIN
jgi:hypothetical protein